MEAYRDSIEHLGAELARLDVLLQRELTLARATAPQNVQEELRGLVITEDEIDSLGHQADYLGDRWRHEARLAATLAPFDARAAARRAEIEARCDLAREAGIWLALPALARRFKLSRIEIDAVLIAVAPEVEPRYETLFAYLQNDVTRKRPSVDLTLNIISRSAREKLSARRLLRPGAPLVDLRLITLGEESHDRHPSSLRRFLKVDEGVVGTILDESWNGTTVGALNGQDLEVEDGTRARLSNLVARLEAGVGATAFVRLVGPSDVALHSAADWIAHRLNRRVRSTDLSELSRDDDASGQLVRDAMITGSVLAVTAAAASDREADAGRQRRSEEQLWRRLASFDDVVMLLGPPGTFLHLPLDAQVWLVEVRPPDFTGRRAAWADELGGPVAADDIGRLAQSFRFGRVHIRQTLALARSLATLRDPTAPAPATRDVLEAGRILTTPELHRFAVRVEPRYTWEDIVLPPEKLEQLRRLANWLRLRHQVHEGWGFGRKLSRGKGLNVLFSGPSGTGKTMAAEVLATELSLDLYQIDLSSVVSKYIGETEKHLSAIFREAEESQAILFFDEADALFGKRTEVKDAHDRYANIEVNFLLQRVEQYEGIVVLASNLQRNVDEAFLRRLHDVVEFPFPDEALRERIWRSHFPAEARRDPDIDFTFLARQFKLTGGSIKNIVLDAAFRAAEQSHPIGMPYLVLATKAELQKQGKLPTKADFDRYYGLIQATARVGQLVGS